MKVSKAEIYRRIKKDYAKKNKLQPYESLVIDKRDKEIIDIAVRYFKELQIRRRW